MADNQNRKFALAGLKKYFDNKTGILSKTNLDENVSNFFKQGVSNVKQSYNAGGGLDQYNVFSRPASRVVSDVSNIGQRLGLSQQTSQDIGYGLRGAASVTPMGISNKLFPKTKSAEMFRAEAPTTARQKTAQNIGRTGYEYLLTAPLGGANMVKNTIKKAAIGTGVGAGLGAGLSALFGGDIKEGAKQGAMSGLKAGPLLSVTNPLTQKAIGALGGGMATQQTLGRAIGGGANLIEDEILAKADGINLTNRDRVQSFLIGAALTNNDLAWKQAKSSLQKAGIKNADDMVDLARSRLTYETKYRELMNGDVVPKVVRKSQTEIEGVGRSIDRLLTRDEAIKGGYKVLSPSEEAVLKTKFTQGGFIDLNKEAPKVEPKASPEQQNIIDVAKKDIGRTQDKSSTIKQKLDSFYTQAVDRYYPITKASNIAKGKVRTQGAELRPEYDPTILVRRMTGAGGIADQRFKTELNPILKEMEGSNIDKTDMDLYLVNKRIAGFGTAGRSVAGTDPVKAKAIVDALEAKYGDSIKNTSSKLYTYQDKLLDEMVDSGFISEADRLKVKSSNPDFAPLYRAMDQADNFIGVAAKRTMQGSNPLKLIKGSDAKIEPPTESIIANTFSQRAAIEKNAVAKSIVNLQKIADMGFEKVAKSGEDTITIWNGGEKEYWKVGKEIADTAKGLNEESTNLIVRLMQAPAAILRQGATGRNPEFLIPNIIRDQLDAAVSSKYGYIPFVDYTSGLWEIAKKGLNDRFGTQLDASLYDKWANSGAKIDIGEMSGKKSIQKYFDEKNLKKGVFKWLSKGLDVLGQVSEQPTRVGLFKKGYKKTGNELLAMMDSRDATVDFARMGSKMKTANSIIPFLNVQVQGFDKLIRAAKNNPGKVALLGAIYGATPAITTTLYNLTQYPELYAQIPDYEKENNFVIVTGQSDKGTVDYISIPKGNILPIITNPIENFINYAFNNDTETFGQMATSVISSTLPGIGSGSSLKEIGIKTIGNLTPQAIKPAIEGLMNKSLYKFDRQTQEPKDIVPYYLQSKEPYKQTYDFTPQAYNAIGAVLNVSPLKVKNTLEGYLAGYTKIPVSIIENLYDISKGNEVNKNEVPLMRRFFKQTYETSENKPTMPIEKTPLNERIGLEKAGAWGGTKEAKPITDKTIKRYVSSLELQKTLDMPEDNKYLKKIKSKEVFKESAKIFKDEDIPDNVKDGLYKELGVSKSDIEYYDVAKRTNDEKNAYVLSELESGKIKDRQQLLQFLAMNRKEINGSIVASEGVLKELRDTGFITSDEFKKLNDLKYTTDENGKLVPNVKVSGRGSGAKLKKIKWNAPSVSAPPKVSAPKVSSFKTPVPNLAKLKINPKSAETSVGNYTGKPKQAIAKIKARKINL